MEQYEANRLEESEARAIKPYWGAWATTGFALIVIAVFFMVQLLVFAVFLLYSLLSNGGGGVSAAMENVVSSSGAVAAAGIVFTAVICIPVVAIFIRLRRGVAIRDYVGLRPVGVKAILLWLAVDVIFLVVTEGVRYAFHIPQNRSDVELYTTSLWLPLFFVAIVVFAPAFEEVLFRGFMFQGYSSSRGGPVFAVIATAAMWAALHIYVGAYDLAVIFAAGLLFAIARWKTGSLWITLAMHAFWNALAFIALAASTVST
jgi:membrane protease YdiL (CAAX protease family)